MMKKIISVLLVMSMLLSGLVGCAKKDTVEDYNSDETVNLTIGVPQMVSVSDYEDNALTRYLEESLNVKLEFEFYSSNASEYTQQLTLLCSSGEELPDVLWGFTGMSRSTMNQFGEDGYFVDLTELLEKYGTNYNEKLASVSKDVRKIIVSRGTNVNNGAFYGMPTYTTSIVADYMQNMMTINKNWLNAVGMNAPKNVDELYNVLKAFQTKDPNGNGEADEIPMMSSNIWLYVINAFVYYDELNPFNVTDGKVWNPVTTNEYRQALIYLNKLCSEGLLSDLSLTASNADIKTLVSGNGDTAKVGIWCGHPSLTTTTVTEVLDEYTALAPLDGATELGGYGVQYPNTLAYGGFITKDCENQVAAIRLLDFFYNDETAIRLRHGEKDVDWEEGKGESVFGTESTIKVINSQAFFEGNSTWGITGTTFMTPENNLAISVTGEGREAENSRIMKEHMDVMAKFNRPDELAVYLVYTDEEQATKDELEGAYNSYVKEARSLFIKGTMNPNNDNDWNTYLETIEKCGGSKLLKVYQSSYKATYK